MNAPPSPSSARSRRPFARAERLIETAVHRPGAVWWLVLITAVENTFVPLTVEPIVVPLMALYRDRIVPFALAMLAGSILGGLAMYGLGIALAAGFAPWLADIAGVDAAGGFVERLEEHGFWVIFAFAVSPLPYQIATLGAGLASYPFAWFMVAIVVGRTLLYTGFAIVVWVLGTAAHEQMERYKMPVLIAGTVVAIGFIGATVIWG